MKLCSVHFAFFLLLLVSPSVQGQTVRDPQWGFSFQAPPGWTYQFDATGAILGHQTIPGMLLVIPHNAGSLEELESLLKEGFNEESITLSLSGKITAAGKNVLSGAYEGEYQGQRIRAKGYGLLSGSGSGTYVIALCTPENYQKQLEAAADLLVRSVEFERSEPSDVNAHLVGTWVTVTKSTETAVTLGGDGRFFTNYVASYSGTESGQWGLAREDKSAGRWSARGSREQGTITLHYTNGKEQTIEYRVHRENGEVYWNEYWFNGDLYGRK